MQQNVSFKNLFKMPVDVLDKTIKEPALAFYTKIQNNEVIDDMEEFRYFLLCLDRLYQEGYISPLRDMEYDECLEVYLDKGGSMIRGDLSSGNKATHKYPSLKGTIKKVHYILEKDRKLGSVKNHKSFQNFLDKVFKDYNLSQCHIGLYPKYDGLSIILEIEDGVIKSAITRGDKELGTGQNKTNALKCISFKNLCDELGISKFGLKCEAIVTKSDYKKYNQKYGNNKLVDPRSAATAILNQDNPNPDELKYLKLIPLMIEYKGKDYPLPILDKMDAPFNYHTFDNILNDIPSYGPLIISKEIDLVYLKKVIKKIEKLCKESDFPYDGIVIRITDDSLIKALGRNDKDCINNFERAFKFAPESKKTKIIDVEQNIGLLGKVSFTAKVEPVKIKNKVIKSVSLGSLERFKNLNLGRNDEVLIQYDIIPYLTVDNTCQKSNDERFELITKCPICGEPLEYDPELSCLNSNCPSRMIGKIYNYCSKLGLDGIGEETISVLFNKGLIKKITDLYELKEKIYLLEDIDGFGKKSIKNLLDSIDSVKEVTEAKLLGSLGIPSCGRRVFESLLEQIPLNQLMEIKDVNEFPEIKGFGSKTFEKIIDGISINREEILKLMKILKVKKSSKPKLLVCFSMIRDNAIEEALTKNGCEYTYSLNKKVDILVVPNKSVTSTKITKAQNWNIKIIDIEEARQLFLKGEDKNA